MLLRYGMHCEQLIHDDVEFRRFVIALNGMDGVRNPTQIYVSTTEIMETVQEAHFSLDSYLKALQEDGYARVNPAIGGVAVFPRINQLARAAKKAESGT